MSLDKIEQAQAILGEHCKHYVILAELPEYKDEVQIRTDSSITAMGLIYCAQIQNKDILDVDNKLEIEWIDDDDNDEQSESE